MTYEEIVALVKAGYTKSEIAAMQNNPKPQSDPKPHSDPIAELTAKITALTSAIQANGILNTNQPKQESAEDILAALLNPNN